MCLYHSNEGIQSLIHVKGYTNVGVAFADHQGAGSESINYRIGEYKSDLTAKRMSGERAVLGPTNLELYRMTGLSMETSCTDIKTSSSHLGINLEQLPKEQ